VKVSRGALPLDHDSLEDLHPAPLPLDDLEVDTHRVPRLELRDSVAQLTLLDQVDGVRHGKGGPKAGGKC
jgi:hypothetical protein